MSTESDMYYEEHHELVGLFKTMPESAYEKLRDDIAEHGLNNPISVWMVEPLDQESYRVIDGRHRLRACKELGIDPPWDYMTFRDIDAARAFVNSQNHMRRKNVMQRSNKDKRADIARELSIDHDRSNAMISEICKVSRDMVQSVREQLGLHSDNRKAADGSVYTATDKAAENSKSAACEETPTSAPESAKQVENQVEDLSKEVEAVEMTPEKLVDALWPDSTPRSKQTYRKPIRDILETTIGRRMAERYKGQTAASMPGFVKNIKAGKFDLRIGWPNVGSGFAAVHSYKAGSTTSLRYTGRIDDLDRINEANEGFGDYKQTVNSKKWWGDISLMDAKPAPEPTNIDDHPARKHPELKWFGQVIKWWEYGIEDATFIEAHCAAQMVSHWYSYAVIEAAAKAGKPIGRHDIANFSTLTRHFGDYVDGVARSKLARRVIVDMCSAMDKSKSHDDWGRGDIPQRQYHTKQG